MMDVNNEIMKDGVVVDATKEAPSILDISKPKLDGSDVSKPQLDGNGNGRKKRRRGKSKRKLMKPYMKVSWQDRRKIDKTKRNRFRKIMLAKTHAPFNNNQFLMEIHKPEPENNFQLLQTPSRTRDSSFSVDSEENYFYSLPEDEEEYLTKEFSSVYEDAQCERLSNMSKTDLIQEYLLLEAKYDALIKRTERSKLKYEDSNDTTVAEQEASLSDTVMTDRDTSGTSKSSSMDEPSVVELMQRMKQQEEQIRELQIANEKLRLENAHFHQQSQDVSSEDSESDSSSTSGSSSSCSSKSSSPAPVTVAAAGPMEADGEEMPNGSLPEPTQNGETEDLDTAQPILNGFHSPNV